MSHSPRGRLWESGMRTAPHSTGLSSPWIKRTLYRGVLSPPLVANAVSKQVDVTRADGARPIRGFSPSAQTNGGPALAPRIPEQAGGVSERPLPVSTVGHPPIPPKKFGAGAPDSQGGRLLPGGLARRKEGYRRLLLPCHSRASLGHRDCSYSAGGDAEGIGPRRIVGSWGGFTIT